MVIVLAVEKKQFCLLFTELFLIYQLNVLGEQKHCYFEILT